MDDLFAGDPSGFVAARDALAKSLRAAGDREGAATVKALRRPSVAAWYVNVAARASLVSLREWLALGASLRAAQAEPDMARVRSLGAGRAALENRGVRDLTAHLGALGVAVSAPAIEEVRATLRAALADEAAADLVSAGRLERALSYGGFGEVDVSAALAAWAAAAPTRDGDEDRSHSAGEQPVEAPAAEPVEAPAAEPVEAPDPALITAVEEAREQRDSAENALAHAEAALAVAQRELREAKAALASAQKDLTTAEKNLEDAR